MDGFDAFKRWQKQKAGRINHVLDRLETPHAAYAFSAFINFVILEKKYTARHP